MNKIFRKELTIGILVIVAMVVLFYGINFLKGINIFKAANYFYATYDNVAGIAQSAPVTLNGYKVGIVREINYDYNRPGNVTLEISVDKNLRLPKGTKATIVCDILGTATVDLTLGKASDGYYNVGDTVAGATDMGLMGSLNDKLMPGVGEMFVKIDTLLSNLNALTGDPALTAGVKRLDKITLELEASVTQLHSILNAMGPIASDVKSITANVDTITGDLAHVSGQLRHAPVDSILTNLESTVANLKEITASLDNPDSSIGKLTHQTELYDNINATVVSLDSLFTDIKKNPKRYINIKLL